MVSDETYEDELTQEEQTQRIIELFARGVMRLVLEENNIPKDKPSFNKDSESTEYIDLRTHKGRIPFGQQSAERGRAENSSETFWIQRIIELNMQGYSSEKIARQLNQEDRTSCRAGKWTRTAVWRILQRTK